MAKSTTDVNRIDQAQPRLAVAEFGQAAAAAKTCWRRLRLKYEKQEDRALDSQGQHAEARYEQEKARLAVAKGKRPSNSFTLTQFDHQVSEAPTRWDKERMELDKLEGRELAEREPLPGTCAAAHRCSQSGAAAGCATRIAAKQWGLLALMIPPS